MLAGRLLKGHLSNMDKTGCATGTALNGKIPTKTPRDIVGGKRKVHIIRIIR